MKTHRERGSVILLSAVLLPVLIFLVGLGTDAGLMFAARNLTQNTADAAAMAGAYACYLDKGACLSNSDAQTAANQAAQVNPILGTVVTPTSVTPYICTDSYGSGNYCVKVLLSASSPVFFARIFGWGAVPVNVESTAQTNTGFGYALDCPKPIFLPDMVLIPPDTTPKSISSLESGTVLPDIRPQDPDKALVPSNYYSLDYSSLLAPEDDPNAVTPVVFSDGTADTDGGAHVYRDSWSKCMVNDLKCGQKVRVQTGVSVGPTNQGVLALINQIKSGDVTGFYSPVWDSTQQVKIGNNFYATITGFAYLTNLQCTGGGPGGACASKSQIQATFQQYLDCDSGSLTPTPGSYDQPVRLVNPNLTNTD